MLLSRTISSMVATVSTVVALGAQTFTTVDVPFAAACQQVSSINPAGNMVGGYLDTAGVIHGYMNTSLEPVYFQVMLGRAKPETMGYADDALFQRRSAHLG